MIRLFGLALVMFLLVWSPVKGITEQLDITDLLDKKAKLFFPQNVGDEHTYNKTGNGIEGNKEWTNKVLEKDGKFFKHSNFFGDETIHFVRVNGKGQVFERTADKEKALWYHLGKAKDKSWKFKLASDSTCLNKATVTVLSRSETIQVPAGKFENCIRLGFKTSCQDAGITEQWFAQDVGLIKQIESSIAGPITSELVSAKVGSAIVPQK